MPGFSLSGPWVGGGYPVYASPSTMVGIHTPVYASLTPVCRWCTYPGVYILPLVYVRYWACVHLLGCRKCTFGRGVEGERVPSEKGVKEVKKRDSCSKGSPPWGYTLGFEPFLLFCTVCASQGPEPPFNASRVIRRFPCC